MLGFFDVVIALLQELLDDVFHILADITGFGQCGRIGHGEGDIQRARQGFGQERLARTGRADQEDIGFGQFHIIGLLLAAFDALVLGARLADHVLIEDGEDFLRFGQAGVRRLGFF